MDQVDKLVQGTVVPPINRLLSNKWLLSQAFLFFALAMTQLILVSLLQGDVRNSTEPTSTKTRRLALGLQVISFIVFFFVLGLFFGSVQSGAKGGLTSQPWTLLAVWIILALIVVACSSMATTSLPSDTAPVGTLATTNTTLNLALLIIQFLVVLYLGIGYRQPLAEILVELPTSMGISGGISGGMQTSPMYRRAQVPNQFHN